MNRMALIGALGVIAGIAAIAGPAHAAPGDFSFDTVEGYELIDWHINVTGIVTGEGGATTQRLNFDRVDERNFNRCERMLAMSISRPARYRVKYVSAAQRCALERR